jgi:hypothetical protein
MNVQFDAFAERDGMHELDAITGGSEFDFVVPPLKRWKAREVPRNHAHAKPVVVTHKRGVRGRSFVFRP